MLVLWWLCHYYYVEPNFCVFLSLPGYSFPFEATVTIQEHCHTATSSFQVAEAMFQSSSVGSSLNSVAALVAVAKMLWFSAYSRSLMLLLGMPCLMLRISSLFFFFFFLRGFSPAIEVVDTALKQQAGGGQLGSAIGSLSLTGSAHAWIMPLLLRDLASLAAAWKGRRHDSKVWGSSCFLQ